MALEENIKKVLDQIPEADEFELPIIEKKLQLLVGFMPPIIPPIN